LRAYEILSPLGAGGMGEVDRARDSRLSRDVAVKVLSDARARDPEYLARFEREARLLASLEHPNIAVITGWKRRTARGSSSWSSWRGRRSPQRSRDRRRSLAAIEIEKPLRRAGRKSSTGHGKRPPRSLRRAEFPSTDPLQEKRRKVSRVFPSRSPELGDHLVAVGDENPDAALDLPEIRTQVVLQALHADPLDGLHAVDSSYR